MDDTSTCKDMSVETSGPGESGSGPCGFGPSPTGSMDPYLRISHTLDRLSTTTLRPTPGSYRWASRSRRNFDRPVPPPSSYSRHSGTSSLCTAFQTSWSWYRWSGSFSI